MVTEQSPAAFTTCRPELRRMSRSSPIDVLVIGGSGIDYMVRAAELPSRGRSATGDAFCRDTGGKGLNQAIATARLGARSALISCIGADSAGDDVLHTLSDAG